MLKEGPFFNIGDVFESSNLSSRINDCLDTSPVRDQITAILNRAYRHNCKVRSYGEALKVFNEALIISRNINPFTEAKLRLEISAEIVNSPLGCRKNAIEIITPALAFFSEGCNDWVRSALNYSKLIYDEISSRVRTKASGVITQDLLSLDSAIEHLERVLVTSYCENDFSKKISVCTRLVTSINLRYELSPETRSIFERMRGRRHNGDIKTLKQIFDLCTAMLKKPTLDNYYYFWRILFRSNVEAVREIAHHISGEDSIGLLFSAVISIRDVIDTQSRVVSDHEIYEFIRQLAAVTRDVVYKSDINQASTLLNDFNVYAEKGLKQIDECDRAQFIPTIQIISEEMALIIERRMMRKKSQ